MSRRDAPAAPRSADLYPFAPGAIEAQPRGRTRWYWRFLLQLLLVFGITGVLACLGGLAAGYAAGKGWL